MQMAKRDFKERFETHAVDLVAAGALQPGKRDKFVFPKTQQGWLKAIDHLQKIERKAGKNAGTEAPGVEEMEEDAEDAGSGRGQEEGEKDKEEDEDEEEDDDEDEEEEQEQDQEEEGLLKASAMNEENPERDRAAEEVVVEGRRKRRRRGRRRGRRRRRRRSRVGSKSRRSRHQRRRRWRRRGEERLLVANVGVGRIRSSYTRNLRWAEAGPAVGEGPGEGAGVNNNKQF